LFVSVRHLAEREGLLSSRPNSDGSFKPNGRFAPILLKKSKIELHRKSRES
jgi:hypothetical protein